MTSGRPSLPPAGGSRPRRSGRACAGRFGLARAAVLARLGLCIALAGCASTQVELSGNTPATSLCQAPGEALSALVLWGPGWRPDQKDVPQREAAARQGLEDFLATSACFATHELRRLPGGSSAVEPSDSELLALAAASQPRPDRVLVVIVRELGPVVKLLSSASLVEGGTEVVLGITVVDARSGLLLARYRAHWQNGGAMVVKGVSSLPQDMSAAMKAALSPAGRAP